MIWVLLTLLFVFLLTIGAYVYGSLPAWRLRHIPAPPYTWGIGHVPLLQNHNAQIFVKFAQEYGPVYRFHFGRQPVAVVADADLCRELGVKNFKSASNRSTFFSVDTTPALKKGLIFTKGSRWSSMRSVLMPCFRSEQLSQHLSVLHRIVGTLLEQLRSIRKQEDVNISDLLHKMAIDVIGEAAFGTKFGQLDNEVEAVDLDLVEATMNAVRSIRMDGGAPLSTVVAMLCPILRHPVREILCKLPGTADRWLRKSNERLIKALDEVVERRRKDRASWTRDHADAASLLLKAGDECKTSRKYLTEDYISALAFELILAGSDTSATTVAFLLYLVSANQEVERKLLQEIDAFGPSDRPLSFEDLGSFPYVEQVIKETLRMYSVAPVMSREISENMELGGYHLPKGTAVLMAPIAMSYDARHFEKPERFVPERFSEESEENKRRHPYAYFPFGIGPRTCIGNRFAMQEIKVAVIRLYQNFTFTHSAAMEKPLALHYGLILQPKFGVRLNVHPRWI